MQATESPRQGTGGDEKFSELILPSAIRPDRPDSKALARVHQALEKSGCSEYRNDRWDCPVCGGENQLSVQLTDDKTKVIVFCFRRCPFDEVIAALGLKTSDVFEMLTPEELYNDQMFQYVLGQTYDISERQQLEYDRRLSEEVFRLKIRDDARKLYTARMATYPPTASTDEIEALPDAQWLIDGVLEHGVVAFLIGFTGTAKTFVANDWAMSVATGKSWFGHTVRQDAVLFIAAEGGRSHKKRAKAWKIFHKRGSLELMRWKTQPVQIMNDHHFEELLGEIRDCKYRLVVIDTLSRCFVGYDQKNDTDTGPLFDRLQKLRDAIEPYGTTVLVLHHTGWGDKDRARGSSDLVSSADAEYVLQADDIFTGVQLKCTKMKDEETWSRNLRMEKVEIGPDSKGNIRTSLVVTDGPAELALTKSNDPRKLDQTWRRNFLTSYEFDSPLSVTEITKVVNQHRHKNEPVSDWTIRQDLKAVGFAETKSGNKSLWSRGDLAA